MGSSPENCKTEESGRQLLNRFIAIDWPAEDVMSLSLTSQNRCYAAIRPYLEENGLYRIPVVSYSLETQDTEEVLIEPRDQESKGSSLFTTFAGLHQQAACVIARRSRYPKIIENYRLLRVMIDPSDDTVFALGSRAGGGCILVLEIARPETRDPVIIRELVQIPGLSENDEFTGTIVGNDGNRHILITALVGANRHAVFKIDLSGRLPDTLPGSPTSDQTGRAFSSTALLCCFR
ncbi:hypothetical protein SGCOL_003084 [Colletotrichum sp. CLE4]